MPTELRIASDRNTLEYSIDGSDFQPVFICFLHKVESCLPHLEEWPDPEQKNLLSSWQVLPPIDTHSDLPHPVDRVERSVGSGIFQATYHDYQLYTYTGSGSGIFPGFWEVATLDRVDKRPVDDACPGDEGDPKISRGP